MRGSTLTAQGKHSLLDRLFDTAKVWDLQRAPDVGLLYEAIVEAPTVQLVEGDERAIGTLHRSTKLLAALSYAPRRGR